MAIRDWSTTATNNNSASPNGFPEGMAPSGVNDSAREVMAQVRGFAQDAQWFDWGHTPTRTGNTTFTVSTDLTAVYSVGRRLKSTGGSTGYATITASSYGAPDTTVTVVNDSGNLPSPLTTVSVGILTASNTALPSGGLFADGSAALPSIAFTLDTDTGIYRIGVNQLGIATAGTLRATFDANGQLLMQAGILLGDGTAGVPAITFNNDTDTGMFRGAADTVSFSLGGTSKLSMSPALFQWTQTEATASFVVRLLGGTNNPGLFVTNTEATTTTRLAASGSTGTFQMELAAGNTVFQSATTTLVTFPISTIFTKVGSGSGSSPIIVKSTTPLIYFHDTDSGVDQAKSRVYHDGSGFRIDRHNDAENTLMSVMAATGTVSGAQTIALGEGTNQTSLTLPLRAPTGNQIDLIYQTGTTNRWILRKDSAAESGANAGSNFSLIARDDAGASLFNALNITRSTGIVQFPQVTYFADGSAATPSVAFNGDTDTGWYRIGSGNVALSLNNAKVWDLSTAIANISGMAQYQFASGVVGTPSISFSTDTNTGVYSVGADDIGITTGGTLRFDISTTAATSTLPLLIPSGTAGAPSVAFSADSGATGLYRTGSNAIGFSTGGSLRLTVTQTEFTAVLPWQGQDGAVGAPAFSFSADTDTGIYRIGANNFGFSAGNSLVGDVLAAASGAMRVADFGGTLQNIGFREIPQNSQSAAYPLVLADSGKHILHPSADTTARTFTIPANGSVAYAIGTALTFVNQNGAGVVTIAITTDTMRLAGPGTTGSRTLAANGIATALKVTATEWIISGTGLT